VDGAAYIQQLERGEHSVRKRKESGQSMLEFALCLPILCFLLLAVVDFARAYSVEKRLEQGAHSATLAVSDPSFSDSGRYSDVANYIAAQAGLTAGTVNPTRTYSADANGNNRVIITAEYKYRLLLPGLRNLQVGGITDGTLAIGVRATGVAPTDPPDIDPTGCSSSHCVSITPSTGRGTPSGLDGLVCTVFWENDATVPPTLSPKALWPNCSTTNPFFYNAPQGQEVTATITQADGVVSRPASPVTVP